MARLSSWIAPESEQTQLRCGSTKILFSPSLVRQCGNCPVLKKPRSSIWRSAAGQGHLCQVASADPRCPEPQVRLRQVPSAKPHDAMAGHHPHQPIFSEPHRLPVWAANGSLKSRVEAPPLFSRYTARVSPDKALLEFHRISPSQSTMDGCGELGFFIGPFFHASLVQQRETTL